MQSSKNLFRSLVALAALLSLFSASCTRRRKYDNPITKDTQQPDKILFDKAIADIEKSRFEVARLTLNTLMNTYDTSEYMAKAKLAVADSWYREGDTHGLAQAEAEYKDFILFYPAMEESAEAQEKVCNIHYKQMEKADRDPKHALRAEDECRLVLTQFPNSKFAPDAQQLLRNIQEVLAQHEYVAGNYYHHKSSFPAASNRLQYLVDQYPLFSQADEALMKLGDAYGKMGPRFLDRSAAAYTRVVKDYPLSPFADEAKSKLGQMERPIPEADPAALARQKYDLANQGKAGFMGKTFGIFSHSPDTRMAAKSGSPSMDTKAPTVPVSVPSAVTTAGLVNADVAIGTVADSSALDNNPDARAKKPGEDTSATAPATPAVPALPSSTLTPATVQAGGGNFTITLTGSGFTPNARVIWNGAVLQSKFVSPTQITAAVPAKFIAVPGNVVVAVNSGGIPTSSSSFTVTPAPEKGASSKKKKK